jgi:hypothetical protein
VRADSATASGAQRFHSVAPVGQAAEDRGPRPEQYDFAENGLASQREFTEKVLSAGADAPPTK